MTEDSFDFDDYSIGFYSVPGIELLSAPVFRFAVDQDGIFRQVCLDLATRSNDVGSLEALLERNIVCF